MRSDTVLLRSAEERDAPVLAELFSALGHPVSAADVARRLARLRDLDPRSFQAVAEADDLVVGFVAAHLTPMLHRELPVGRVTTLVVADGRRGQGIGSFLLAAAESWCRDQGTVRIELTTGAERADAHAFYDRRGFRREGLRFVRED